MRKIVHVIIACFYKEGYGYQENILPKKHKELGLSVDIITCNRVGRTATPEIVPPATYTNPDGIPVHLLAANHSFWKKVPKLNIVAKETEGLFEKLEEIKPDIIFVHGIGALDNMEVIEYKKKHAEVQIFADNHSDYYNAAVNTFQRKLLRWFYKITIGRALSKYAEHIWGVTPWRVKYQEDVYGISHSKSGLLVMGGDESFINWDRKSQIRKEIREKLCIPDDSFVIISGGKIDRAKNIHHLVEAIQQLDNPSVHLILFGKIEDDISELSQSFEKPFVRNVGWIGSNDCYNYFLASDLAVFPGTHSVLWEQACAAGLPGVFKDWDGGFNHVDVGGNCILCKDCTTEGLQGTLQRVINTPLYFKMKDVAEDKGIKTFSYIEIAKRSIRI